MPQVVGAAAERGAVLRLDEDATVEKHVSAIFGKLGLPPSDHEHWRVRAVLTYLGA